MKREGHRYPQADSLMVVVSGVREVLTISIYHDLLTIMDELLVFRYTEGEEL